MPLAVFSNFAKLSDNMRAFLIVLDSVGIGAAPDADDYGDEGSNTLANLAAAVGGLNVPALQSMGLGNIPAVMPNGKPLAGVPAADAPSCAYGVLQEASEGKDTTTGHWEMMGIEMKRGFALFPKDYPSFPRELIDPIETNSGRRIIGNIAASGTAIIQELGDEHVRSGAIIVYTSADSVLQVAAHENVVPLEELYSICGMIRELANPYRIGRVIARPFIGRSGNYTRTENRRDFSYPLPEPMLLDKLTENGVRVVTVGKLDDIFAGQGITESRHVENNRDAQNHLLELASSTDSSPCFVFANLIDFDMLYGHRRDTSGYAGALEDTDSFLAKFLPLLKNDDILLITADHGNDPTFKGSDHTREYVPLLVKARGLAGLSLGIRKGFYDIAQSLAGFFNIPSMRRGLSFLHENSHTST